TSCFPPCSSSSSPCWASCAGDIDSNHGRDTSCCACAPSTLWHYWSSTRAPRPLSN
ncbi:uncharacterized protein METZ01_LOCUS428842, partial [marine metagenome]